MHTERGQLTIEDRPRSVGRGSGVGCPACHSTARLRGGKDEVFNSLVDREDNVLDASLQVARNTSASATWRSARDTGKKGDAP